MKSVLIAASVGLILQVTGSHAALVSSSAGYGLPVVFSSTADSSYDLDLNHDGIIDYTFTNIAIGAEGQNVPGGPAGGLVLSGGSNIALAAIGTTYLYGFHTIDLGDAPSDVNKATPSTGDNRLAYYAVGGFSFLHELNGSTGYIGLSFADANGTMTNGYLAGIFDDSQARNAITFTLTDYGFDPGATEVPEPTTIALLAACTGFGVVRRRRS